MTRDAARAAIAEALGGIDRGSGIWQFPDLEAADQCKAVLDAFDPGMTGDVFFTGRLMLAPGLNIAAA